MTAVHVLGEKRGAHRKTRRKRRFVWLPNWIMLFVLLIGLGLAVLALYLFSPDWLNLERPLPVGMRSPLRANYAADPFTREQPPVGAHILAEALVDRSGVGETGPTGPLATLAERLESPVPSVTPPFGSTPAVVQTVVPSGTPTEATATRTAQVTNTPTATRTVIATVTVTRTVTPTATNTAVIYQPSPTSGTIHKPTSIVPTTAPTATGAAPATRVPPTATAVPPATSTPVPPTTVPPTAVPPTAVPPTQPAYPPPGTAYP